MAKTEVLNAPVALDKITPFLETRLGRKQRGFHRTSPFKALIGTMLSLRARGATVGRIEGLLFARVHSPQEIVDMPSEELRELIRPLGHSERRTKFIRETCELLISQHGGQVPDDLDKLLALPGVGRKTANLTLDAGFGHRTITVDTHVHRIMNIWGYVDTKNADETETALRDKLPKKYWKSFNPVLVDFGNEICWPTSPKCSECPLDTLCPKNGVTRKR